MTAYSRKEPTMVEVKATIPSKDEEGKDVNFVITAGAGADMLHIKLGYYEAEVSVDDLETAMEAVLGAQAVFVPDFSDTDDALRALFDDDDAAA